MKGFDKYLGEDEIRNQLTEAFKACGGVTAVRLPTDRESGEIKGIGFVQFDTVEGKVSGPHAELRLALPGSWFACLISHYKAQAGG